MYNAKPRSLHHYCIVFYYISFGVKGRIGGVDPLHILTAGSVFIRLWLNA